MGTDPNTKVANNYADIGTAAQKRGDWEAARTAYARAVVNTELAKLDTRGRAIMHYEYGRSLGATCYFGEAEREINLALHLDRDARQPLHYSLVELARLNLDQRKYERAMWYFQQALGALDQLNAAREASSEYSVIMEEYASALSGAGRNEEAALVRQRAAQIKVANPGSYSITERTPYGRHCRQAVNVN